MELSARSGILGSLTISDINWKLNCLETMEEGTDLSILGDHRIASSQQYVPGTKGQTEFEIDQVFPAEIRKYLCPKRHDKAVSEYHVQLQFSLLKKMGTQAATNP